MRVNTFLVFIKILATLGMIVSCGGHHPLTKKKEGASYFEINNYILFALDEDNTLLPKPDISGVWQEFIPLLTYNTPTLSFRNKEDILAKFVEPSEYTLPTFKPAPVALPSSSCALGNLLTRISQNLAEISYAKDTHSRVPATLLSFEACQTKKVLECFLNELSLTPWEYFPESHVRGMILKNIVANLQTCGGSKGLWETRSYFEIRNNSMYFFPDPLYSIRIFEGKQENYTWATDHLNSVAKLININCKSNACFSSPQPYQDLFKCNSCTQLIPGKQYTAFLQLAREEKEENFVKIFFSVPTHTEK